MRSPPPGLDPALVAPELAAWGLHRVALDYAPLGFGSYHWIARTPAGERRFVTADDLTTKPWLGDDADTTYIGLRAAMATAAALLAEGLDFVVAPLPSEGGDTIRRIDARYALTVFPFIEGAGFEVRAEMPAADLARLIETLAALHRAPPAARALAPVRGVALPGRSVLEAALAGLARPWTGGPLAEPARAWLGEHASRVAAATATFDRLAAAVASAGAPPVLTHGEPHPGNLLRRDGRLLLVDWDTVAIAPPERDLWSLVRRSPDAAALYADTAGRALDPRAIELFRLAWDLGDLAAYLRVFRAPHERTADTEKALAGMTRAITLG